MPKLPVARMAIQYLTRECVSFVRCNLVAHSDRTAYEKFDRSREGMLASTIGKNVKLCAVNLLGC